ncbi:hypothetical protein Hdeb2414_s0009g00327251 [Helianthus debilis subsp. tardiflorus]
MLLYSKTVNLQKQNMQIGLKQFSLTIRLFLFSFDMNISFYRVLKPIQVDSFYISFWAYSGNSFYYFNIKIMFFYNFFLLLNTLHSFCFSLFSQHIITIIVLPFGPTNVRRKLMQRKLQISLNCNFLS